MPKMGSSVDWPGSRQGLGNLEICQKKLLKLKKQSKNE